MGRCVLQGRTGQLGPLLPRPVKGHGPGVTACRCTSRAEGDQQRTADTARRAMLAMLFSTGLAAPAQAAKPAPPPKKDAYQVCI